MKTVRTIPGYVREIPANVDESRIIEFTITNSTRDRHKSVVNSDKWEMTNFLANPIVGYQHNVYGSFFSKPDPDLIIGKSVNLRKEGNDWISGVHFEPGKMNKLADKIFNKVKFGTLRAASVGFMEIGDGNYGDGEEREGGKSETYYFAGQELLEFSIVNIPSNPTATKRDGYKEPTVADILNKYSELSKEFSEEELRKTGIIEFLKSIEGITELNLTRKPELKLLNLAEKRLRIIQK